DDRVGTQVGLRGRRPPERDRLVGLEGERSPAVRLGEDGDGADPELAAGAEDPPRDLAAVGHEHLADRLHAGTGHAYIRKTPKRSVPRTSAEWTAERARPRTVRVSRGSTIPSSHIRAVE